MIQALCGRDDWERTAEMVRETTTKVSCVSSGFLKDFLRKDRKLGGGMWKGRKIFKGMQRNSVKVNFMAKADRSTGSLGVAKHKAYSKLYVKLDTKEGENDFCQLVRQRD